MSDNLKAYLVRAAWTMLEAAVAAVLMAIGDATTLGAVDWTHVASMAGMAALTSLLSFIKSWTFGVPETSNNTNPEDGHPAD